MGWIAALISTSVLVILWFWEVRRRLREICRLNQNKLTHGHDLVIVVRMKSRDVEYARLEADFLDSCGQLGILERPEAQR